MFIGFLFGEPKKVFFHLVQAMSFKKFCKEEGKKYLHCKAINKEAIIITAEAEYISHMKCESDVKKIANCKS